MEFGRKRGAEGADFDGNGGSKRHKDESKSFSTGVGSKSKPCMKFFSTSGCAFGETCHFLHHVPGYSAMAQLKILGSNPANTVGKNATPFTDGSAPNVKTKLCNKMNTAEGCRFGDKCQFAHSKMEIGKTLLPSYEDYRGAGPNSRLHGQFETRKPGVTAAASFGTSATTTISIDASLAGPIIGKNGVNVKQIFRATGVNLSIKPHDKDESKRNIELEGSYDQINQASNIVREIIMNLRPPTGGPRNATASFSRTPAGPYKTKLCTNFPKGTCTFGDKCHFAHGASELQDPPS